MLCIFGAPGRYPLRREISGGRRGACVLFPQGGGGYFIEKRKSIKKFNGRYKKRQYNILTSFLLSANIGPSQISQMRLSGKSSREKGFRELPGGARQQRNIPSEVHFASSVLKIAVGTTGATVTSLRLLSLLRSRPAGRYESRVVPRSFLRPCFYGVFFIAAAFGYGAKSDEALAVRRGKAEWYRDFFVPVIRGVFYF